MNTIQLECFLAVSENLNFARAAEQLHITQPAVTHQIHSLETELNTRLFVRTTRSVELTPAGFAFISDASDILGRTRAAKARFPAAIPDRYLSFYRLPWAAGAEPAPSRPPKSQKRLSPTPSDHQAGSFTPHAESDSGRNHPCIVRLCGRNRKNRRTFSCFFKKDRHFCHTGKNTCLLYSFPGTSSCLQRKPFLS